MQDVQGTFTWIGRKYSVSLPPLSQYQSHWPLCSVRDMLTVAGIGAGRDIMLKSMGHLTACAGGEAASDS